MPDLTETSGVRYLESTRFMRRDIKDYQREAIAETDPFKTYPGAKTTSLPRSWDLIESEIVPLLQNRRSLRKYSENAIDLTELAFMLWASQGITAQAGNYFFRTSPSGGALYPIETYLSVQRVEGLETGLYHYNVGDFSLERLESGETGEKIASACLEQKFMAKAPVIFLWSGIFRRSMSKYGNRGMRYILLDAGHVCQNLLMGAEAIECGGCPVAAFYDDELNGLLQLDGEEESVLYTAAVGKKRS
ncbi:MAG: SagB/ThcOx family dehydrogenase [Thermodesulfobacteriota bacterium]